MAGGGESQCLAGTQREGASGSFWDSMQTPFSAATLMPRAAGLITELTSSSMVCELPQQHWGHVDPSKSVAGTVSVQPAAKTVASCRLIQI